MLRSTLAIIAVLGATALTLDAADAGGRRSGAKVAGSLQRANGTPPASTNGNGLFQSNGAIYYGTTNSGPQDVRTFFEELLKTNG